MILIITIAEPFFLQKFSNGIDFFFNVPSLNNGISCDPYCGEAGGELSKLRNLILTIFTYVFTFFLMFIASWSNRWKLTKADRIMMMNNEYGG